MKSAVYHRVEGIFVQELDGELFLANEEDGSIYHLNAIGAAFWRVLESPSNLETIIHWFECAFPDQSRPRLRQEISDLAGQLEYEGLILPKRK